VEDITVAGEDLLDVVTVSQVHQATHGRDVEGEDIAVATVTLTHEPVT
jgi:hypothetical protein